MVSNIKVKLFCLVIGFSGAFFVTGCSKEQIGSSTQLDVKYASSDTSGSLADGSGDGGTDGATDGTTDGATDGITNGAADGITDGITDGVTDGAADGAGEVDGATEGSANNDDPPVCNGDTAVASSKSSSPVEKIVATLSTIRFHSTEGGHFNISVNETFDLLDLGSGGAGPSSGVKIPQEEYKKIRLYFSCAEVHLEDGTVEPIKITANNSIMFHFNPRLDLRDVSEDEILIYFDVRSGLSWNDEDGWKLNQAKVQIN